ncbi:uncharacterized protein LOC129731109 [Wyeomyia smithii]|uniref:uncharacterized protein LOC129731109 n=1 Tax=Wyeomyia smithii TaxID=174621 RepID=UPI002467B8A2|nr:uncharacterized protein LOC129731109 [Wyeomyia smithii]
MHPIGLTLVVGILYLVVGYGQPDKEELKGDGFSMRLEYYEDEETAPALDQAGEGKIETRKTGLPEVCSRSDPELSKCITNVMNSIRFNLAEGDFGYGPLAPTLDPYRIKLLDIENGQSFKVLLRNTTIGGIGDYQIENLRQDLSQKKFTFRLKLPTLLTKGKYDLNMYIFLLRVYGKGDFNMTLIDTIADMTAQYFLQEQDGKNYVKFRPMDVRLQFGKASFYLDNLFDGDQNLGQIGNSAVNNYPYLLLDQVKTGIETHLRRSVTTMANAIVNGAEENEILLP